MVRTKRQLDLLTRYTLSGDPMERLELEKELRRYLSENESSRVTIQSVLREVGVPTNLKGYKYIVRAVELYMEGDYSGMFVTGIYGGIADEFNTTASRVERAMRHCVEVAMARCDFDVLKQYFGNTISPSSGVPVMQHFISRLAEVVREG